MLLRNLFLSVTIGDRVVVTGLLKCEDVFLQNGTRLFAQIYLEANNIFSFDHKTLILPVKSTITPTKHFERLGSNISSRFLRDDKMKI
jgi:DNA replicative helicase MCM subunit Mcm2 (Cdc46/Mcm family)